jgi:hypothetical protein
MSQLQGMPQSPTVAKAVVVYTALLGLLLLLLQLVLLPE